MTNSETRLVVFDRDGVLNVSLPGPKGMRGPWLVSEVTVPAGAPETVATLRAAGYELAVATNQPDVARGDFPASELELINESISSQLPGIGTFYVCLHDTADACECRKPKAGMLLEAAAEVGAEASRSWMVGDRWVDILAGRNAGFWTVLIKDERSMAPTSIGGPPADLVADYVVTSVADVASVILAADKPR